MLRGPRQLTRDDWVARAMKVIGSRQIETSPARRLLRRNEGAGMAFRLDSTSAALSTVPAAAASPLAAVDALLTLQAVPDTGEGRKRAVHRASEMLNFLDDIRLGLLEGRVPEGKLTGLLRVVETHRDSVADPTLSAVLDEIELRARVELAKFGATPAFRPGS